MNGKILDLSGNTISSSDKGSTTPSSREGKSNMGTTVKASQFQTETYTILTIIEEILAPNGYHDKKGVGIVATRPPWITKDDIRKVGAAVRNERILYKNKILKYIKDRQQVCEDCIQSRHNTLVNEQSVFFLLRDKRLILMLEREIAGYKAEINLIQKIQSLLNM